MVPLTTTAQGYGSLPYGTHSDTLDLSVVKTVCSDGSPIGSHFSAIIDTAAPLVDESLWPPDTLSLVGARAVMVVVPRQNQVVGKGILSVAMESIQVGGHSYSLPGRVISATFVDGSSLSARGLFSAIMGQSDPNSQCLKKESRVRVELLDSDFQALRSARKKMRSLSRDTALSIKRSRVVN